MIAAHDVHPGLFVPAILSVGLLFSIGALARDALHRLRGRRWLDRRAVLNGRGAALLVTAGEAATRHDLTGRRPRWVYAVLGSCFTLLAAYLVLGSYGNYVGWTGWVRDIGWIWFLYLVCIAAFGMLGVAIGAIAIWWDAPPSWTRPVIVRSPLGRIPRGHQPEPEHLPVTVPGERVSLRARLDRIVRVDEYAAESARVVASLWSATAVVIFSILALQDLMPTSKDPSTIEHGISGPVQVGLLVLYGLGSLLTIRHEAIGSAVMATATAGIAVLSAIEYPPWMAVLITVALGAPAFLHWVAWQRDRHIRHVAYLALASTVAVLGIVRAADALADFTLGPAHPESTIAAPPPSAVQWVWAGGTTETRTTIVARLEEPHRAVRLAMGTDSALEDPMWSAPQVATDDRSRIVRFEVEGLRPDTVYHYAIEADGELDRARAGQFRSFPDGPASYTVALGTCARSGSNGAVFDALTATEPLVYLQNGDLHYANITDDDPETFVDAFTSALASPSQSRLYRSTSVAYVWDDHDYGGNDADRTSTSRAAAQAAYRLVVPHYPLHGTTDGGPIYQSFEAGRVRYVLLDGRSERDPAGTAEPAMLGAEQEAWLADQLRAAATEDVAVVLVTASPWIDAAQAGSDSWGGFPAQRERIGRLIDELGLADNLVMVAGDGHMIAIDDGTHSGYGGQGFVVFHAGALDRPGGVKGGPYTQGPFPGAGHFGTIEVHDDGGDTVTLTMTGRTWDGQDLAELSLTVDATADDAPQP